MPNSGERVGEYILETKVGQGTFGEVWRARHHIWGERFVAVKVPTNSEYVRALQEEGAAIHGLEHPNIVRALNFDPYANPPYLAMEFVDGSSLRSLMSAKVLNWKDSAAVMSQVLAGLGYAHGRGMIHRDIKPENVLVHKDVGLRGYSAPGLVKLTDFGLGKKTDALAASSMIYTQSIGKGSDVAGTIAYMSPEQRVGGELDGRSDIYSCGVVLFEMLTGERPAGIELPSELVSGLPKGFDDVFRRAYARLGMRYANAAEFQAGLERVLAVELGGGGGAGASSRAGAMPPPIPGTVAGGTWGAAASYAGRAGDGRATAASAAAGGVAIGGSATGGAGAGGAAAGFAAGTAGGAAVGPARGTAGGVAGGISAAGGRCPKCERGVGVTDQFCMGCGQQLVSTIRRCGGCGGYPHPQDRVCLTCGKSVEGAA